MKKKLLAALALIMTVAVIGFTFTACENTGQTAEKTDAPGVECSNGTFVGYVEDNGVLAYKGIPYAKPPTGDLRWKAPEAPDDSDETVEAKEYGKSSVQYEWHSEEASYNEVGEDCLTLNVWTKDVDVKDKPILFFIHGGAFAWGGTSDPLYDGQYMVEEHEDVVVITTNYRVGMYGIIDFSNVEGGEDFPDSSYLSLLDLQQSLKWVKENAEGFGGDPENITIYGESAGGGCVSLLMSMESSEGLFQHAIAESGSVNQTYSQEDFDSKGLTEALLDKTGAKNMDDLMAIPEEELNEIYMEYDKDGNCLNDLYNMPRRGGNSPIPEDPYAAIANGVNKDVDFMVGTNADEWRYWVDEMGDESIIGTDDQEKIDTNMDIYYQDIAKPKMEDIKAVATDEEIAKAEELMANCGEKEKIWQYTELGNETGFRMPSIVCAYNHAKAGGNSYMYYFEKRSTHFDWLGACHANELAYVFHNLEEDSVNGEIDPELADHMCSAWVNFAKSGDPSTKFAEWPQYTTGDRATMIIGDDGSMEMENDPLGEQRKLVEWSAYYYLR